MLPIELGSDSTDSDSTPPKDGQLDLQSAMKIVSKAYSSRRDQLLFAWRSTLQNLQPSLLWGRIPSCQACVILPVLLCNCDCAPQIQKRQEEQVPPQAQVSISIP